MPTDRRARIIRRLTEDDWSTLRALRIAALTDAPDAFGSNLERELAFDEATWRGRLRNPAGVTFVASRDEDDGLVGAIKAPEPAQDPQAAAYPHTADLVSMWVAPQARGTGAAGALIEAVLTWAAEQGCHTVYLWVTEGNVPALALYRSHGFTPTGQKEPLPGRPHLQELRMSRRL